MKRDFSEQARQQLLGMVVQVEQEKWSDFTDWAGDRWYDFQEWLGILDVRHYINNVNDYHRKVIDKNNATEQSINAIFERVAQVDSGYRTRFDDVQQDMLDWKGHIARLSGIISPANGGFDSMVTGFELRSLRWGLEKENEKLVLERLVTEVDGLPVFNEENIYDLLGRKVSDLNEAEKKALAKVISQMEKVVTKYETFASVGAGEWGIEAWKELAWLQGETQFESFTAASAHFSNLYINLLQTITEKSEDKESFAAAILNLNLNELDLSVLGLETAKDLGKIFGSSSFALYAAKFATEHTEHYFAKLGLSEKGSMSVDPPPFIKDFFENKEKSLEDWLEDKGLREEIDDDTVYKDKDGNIIKDKDAPTFYKQELTIAELKKQATADFTLYEGSYQVGKNGKIDAKVGEAEAHAAIKGGFYVIGADGEKKFSPGVDAEVGVSVTAAEAEWEQQWLGDENLGFNTDAGVTVGKAEAKADVGAQVFGDDGKLDVQLGASAKAEAIAAEVEGSAGVNILGGEVGVKGGVNVGIGAKAEVGYRDGVFKLDAGISVGVGVSVGVEIDVGGMVDTVCDAAESAWEGIQDGWEDFKDGWNDFWDW